MNEQPPPRDRDLWPFLAHDSHPDQADYMATNLLPALETCPDTGDWYQEVVSWCKQTMTGKLKPNQTADEQRAVLRKQFEDEHPVLAVIERAREEGLDLEIDEAWEPRWPRVSIILRRRHRDARAQYARPIAAHASRRLAQSVEESQGGDSLDECAQQLLANWPEKT